MASSESPHNVTINRIDPGRDYGMKGTFITIAGIIGAGKTTLATAMSKVLKLPVFYEEVDDNIYLDDFYQDQEKYGFPLQVYLLNKRFQQHQQIIWQGGGIQDRSIYEDSVFAKMLRDSGKMSDRDYQTYVDLFSNMSNFMRKPTLIVYLDVNPEESMRRIKMRHRSMESSIPLEYLQLLYKAYEEFISNISKIVPVVRVDYSKFRTPEEMAEAVSKCYHKMVHVHVATFNDSPCKKQKPDVSS